MSLDVIHEHFSKIMEKKIDSLITKPVMIDPSSTVSHTINTLSQNGSFDAFCKEKQATLCVNIRDLLSGKDIFNMNVRPFLRAIPTLKKGDLIENAVNIITHNRIREAPVVDSEDVIGAVRAKDILKLVSELDNKWIKANQIFTPNPVVVDKTVPLSFAKKIMTNKRLDHLPVVDGDKVLQVLTSYHLLQTLLPPESTGRRDLGSKKLHESNVGNIGTNRLAVCGPHSDLGEIIDSMLHADTTFCLVTLRDSLQGIITYRDILNLLSTRVKSKIPLFIVGMPNEDNANIVTQKFTKTLDKLEKVYPDVQEAKVHVKKLHGVGSRFNYEVSTTIITPHQKFMFSRTGFDLSKVFDEISGRIMRLLSKRAKKRYRLSIRKISR